VELKLNGTHQPLLYVDDVNLLIYNTNAIRGGKIETLMDASKEVGLEVNTKEIQCMLLSQH
jgi:hypothetical protein